jgi:hypothetical protein
LPTDAYARQRLLFRGGKIMLYFVALLWLLACIAGYAKNTAESVIVAVFAIALFIHVEEMKVSQ